MPQLNDYQKYLLEGRKNFLKEEAVSMQKLLSVYNQASQSVALQLRNSKFKTGSASQAALKALDKHLLDVTMSINKETMAIIRGGFSMALENGSYGAKQITLDVTKGVIEAKNIENMFSSINSQAMLSFLSRSTYGMKLSDRVWQVGDSYRSNVRSVVEEGLARGLDSRKLARQVQQYLQPGVATPMKKATAKRLGVSQDVSYQAMRLARTEINNAFHEGTIMSNQASPSYEGMIWHLSSSHPKIDICNDFATHNGTGFWEKGNEPAKPHPQCLCYITPKHLDPDEFATKVKRWASKPTGNKKMEEWYKDTYCPITKTEYVAPEKRPPITPPPNPTPPPVKKVTPPKTVPIPAPPVEISKPEEFNLRKFKKELANESSNDKRYNLMMSKAEELIEKSLTGKVSTISKTEIVDLAPGWNGKIININGEKAAVIYDHELITTELEEFANLKDLREQMNWIQDHMDNIGGEYSKKKTSLFSFLRDAQLRVKDLLTKSCKEVKLEKFVLGKDLEERITPKIPNSLIGSRERIMDEHEKASEWLRTHFEQSIIPGYRVIMVDEAAGTRAYARGMEVHIARSDKADVIVHEVSHVMHLQNQKVLDMTDIFFKKRIQGEKLTEIYRNSGEMGYKDKFFEHYCGKEYNFKHTGIEILSMGIQQMYNNPAKFYATDPEYFTFCYSIMRGMIA